MQAPLQAKNDADAVQTDTARTVAQKRVPADKRPEAVAQGTLAQVMNNSPRVLQQRALSDAIHTRARMVAQRDDMNALFGGAVKAQGAGAMRADASPAQRAEKPNNTGLPDQLKSGIESLSGMSMDHVKVRYNSDKPAQLQAHAYAQGSDSLHDSPRMTVQRKAVESWQAPAPVNRTGLPGGLKSGIEALSGRSMDQVTVHYNSSKPAQLNALAYAQGNDIHVAPSQEKHLPHEAWHVVQQAQGRVKPTRQLQAGVPINDERALEHEADVMGARAQKHDAPAQPATTAQAGVSDRTIQLERAEDPYERGSSDSPQVHHIISHSKIVGGVAALGVHAQAEVKRAYMPDLAHLSLRQLYKISDRFVFTNPNVPLQEENTLSREREEFNAWTEAPLEFLPATIIMVNVGLGFPVGTTLSQFRESYELVQQGQAGAVGNDEFWDGLKDSYVEWSAGNLFYGAQSRAEPGGVNLDEFDGDAKYFRDPDHVARLKQHETALDAATENNDQIQIRQTLLDLAAMNRNAGAGPVNDRARWIKPGNAKQKALILALLPAGPRKDFINGQVPQKTLPRDMVKPLLVELVGKQIKLALDVKAELHKVMGMFKVASGEAPHWHPHDLPDTVNMNLMPAPFSVSLRRNDDKVEVIYEGATVAISALGKTAWKDVSADFARAIKQAMLTSLLI